MAIAPTGALYKAFSFDGVSSRSYGAYLTGEGVYNAPERDVEMIAIPGRNGAYPSDQGRWNNVEITYQATIAAHTEQDFREAMSGLRSLLCSRKGYARLQDEYHPDEYRMAVYKSGLEAEPIGCTQAEFSIVFDCKPQRYLKSGENTISVSNGDTVTNPTAFEAYPMLEVGGYGDIVIGKNTVRVFNAPYGMMQILPASSEIGYTLGTDTLVRWTFPDDRTNDGDVFYVNGVSFSLAFSSTKQLKSVSVSSQTGGRAVAQCSGYSGSVKFTRNNFSFTSPSTNYVDTNGSATLVFTATDDTTSTMTLDFTIKYYAHPSQGVRFLEAYVTQADGSGFVKKATGNNVVIGISSLVANSTIPGLGNPTYIDLEVGMAYKIENDELVQLNSAIALPAELPTLVGGANVITFDNTVTQLKLTPRWWRI